jgi:hypothetical protein
LQSDALCETSIPVAVFAIPWQPYQAFLKRRPCNLHWNELNIVNKDSCTGMVQGIKKQYRITSALMPAQATLKIQQISMFAIIAMLPL